MSPTLSLRNGSRFMLLASAVLCLSLCCSRSHGQDAVDLSAFDAVPVAVSGAEVDLSAFDEPVTLQSTPVDLSAFDIDPPRPAVKPSRQALHRFVELGAEMQGMDRPMASVFLSDRCTCGCGHVGCKCDTPGTVVAANHTIDAWAPSWCTACPQYKAKLGNTVNWHTDTFPDGNDSTLYPAFVADGRLLLTHRSEYESLLKMPADEAVATLRKKAAMTSTAKPAPAVSQAPTKTAVPAMQSISFTPWQKTPGSQGYYWTSLGQWGETPEPGTFYPQAGGLLVPVMPQQTFSRINDSVPSTWSIPVCAGANCR